MNIKQHYKLTLFGGFHLVDANRESLLPGARKSKALLAWLAVNPDQQHPREKLAAMLWPDSEETAARHSLRQALAELRKVIPSDMDVLKTSKDFILLDSELIHIDIQHFIAALSQGDEASLDQAIHLYSGEFLEGCNPHSDMFEEWGLSYRNDFKERAASAIEQRLVDHIQKENHEQVIQLAMRLIGIDSVRESAYRALMLAYSQLNNHASALRWYRRCQHVLEHELDVPPDAETEALYQELVANHQDKDLQTQTPRPQIRQALENSDQYEITIRHNQRLLYQLEAAIEGILDQIGGQSFLIRGDASSGKSEFATQLIELAKIQGFFCCRRKLSSKTESSDAAIMAELTDSFSSCLLSHPAKNQPGKSCSINSRIDNINNNDIAKLVKATSQQQPVLLIVEHIHEANMDTLNLLAELISSAGNCSMLLLMTSRFEGEPLDPVWRGAMRGAPLTTIDMS